MCKDIFKIFIISFLFLLLSMLCYAEKIIVIEKVANIRSGPGANYKIIAQAKKGDLLEVLEERSKWLKIKLEDEKIGWIYRKLAILQEEIEAILQEEIEIEIEIKKVNNDYIWFVSNKNEVQFLKDVLPEAKEGSKVKIIPIPEMPTGILERDDINDICFTLRYKDWEENVIKSNLPNIVAGAIALKDDASPKPDYDKLLNIICKFEEAFKYGYKYSYYGDYGVPKYIFNVKDKISLRKLHKVISDTDILENASEIYITPKEVIAALCVPWNPSDLGDMFFDLRRDMIQLKEDELKEKGISVPLLMLANSDPLIKRIEGISNVCKDSYTILNIIFRRTSYNAFRGLQVSLKRLEEILKELEDEDKMKNYLISKLGTPNYYWLISHKIAKIKNISYRNYFEAIIVKSNEEFIECSPIQNLENVIIKMRMQKELLPNIKIGEKIGIYSWLVEDEKPKESKENSD